MAAVTFDDPACAEQLSARFDARTEEIARLAAVLCSEPGVTVPPEATDFPALARSMAVLTGYAAARGLGVIERPADADHPYPGALIGFGGEAYDEGAEVVALMGHLDVVPAREEGQFTPLLDGDDLVARGAADMKVVLASYVVWMAQRQASGEPRPPLLLVVSCCEENASAQPHHTRSMLTWLSAEHGIRVRFALVGERTGELEWMAPDLTLGPICRENRGWRWLRAEEPAATGWAALRDVADLVRAGRELVADLNAHAVPPDKAERQPGVRSGFVSPFLRVGADAEPPSTHTRVRVRVPAGAAVHAAAASAERPSVVERLAAFSDELAEAVGAGRVHLAAVRIGEDGNFNTWDGSGEVELAVEGLGTGELEACVEGLSFGGLEVTVGGELSAAEGPAVLGLDVRELLDHQGPVERFLADLPSRLWGEAAWSRPNDRPPWRCPDDQPDLAPLLAAWEAVAGKPSPDLVKLHGNDGGSLAQLQQAGDPAYAEAGRADAVVFGQVGLHPHGKDERHRLTSVGPYLDVLDRWAEAWRGA